MSYRTTKVAHCDECGFEWIPKTVSEPERCASQKCRTRAWNKSEWATEGVERPVKVRKQKSSSKGVEAPVWVPDEIADDDLESMMPQDVEAKVPEQWVRCPHRFSSVCDDCAKKPEYK